MERQPRRVRLTDQALVAVTVARQLPGSGRATVAQLLAGLAIEPDGVAGGFLAQPPSAAATLVERAGAASPRLPSLEAAVGWAQPVPGTPVWTVDLLRAAAEIGRGDLDDLLQAAGYDAAALRSALARETRGGGRHLLNLMAIGEVEPTSPGHGRRDPETVGLRAHSDRLTAAAGLAVGRAAAQGGRVRHLVLALKVAEEPGWPPPFLLEAIAGTASAAGRDAVLDEVVERALAEAPAPVDCAALAAAALVHLQASR